MSVPIELQVGDPPRTIYEDIVNLPDPVKLGITIRAFNYDDVGLYFQVTAQCSGWTFETVNLGLLGSGANIHRNLDEFGSRAKPASETEQIIKLILKAYTDAGYSDLKWTYERNVPIVFIKSDDPSYTVDELDNFDDGTVQGWSASNEQGNDSGYPTCEVASDYVLSSPYSLLMKQFYCVSGTGQKRGRLYKSFVTPNKDRVYAILDIRCTINIGHQRNLTIQQDGTILIYLGRPYDAVNLYDYFFRDKWVRIVVPLPKNTTIEIRIVHEFYATMSCAAYFGKVWLDDFKIISR